MDKSLRIIIGTVASLLLLATGFIAAVISAFYSSTKFYTPFTAITTLAVIVFLILLLIPSIPKRKLAWSFLTFIVLAAGSVGVYEGYQQYLERYVVISDKEIDLGKYEPFLSNSEVARLDHPASLQLSGTLPRLDGATALYPLYAAFVQAVYPEDEYSPYSGTAVSTKTTSAYESLVRGETDIIFVASPSEQQVAFAKEHHTELEMTPIGKEAFVFFVSEENPVTGLSVDQIRDIYAGRITNWQQAGGQKHKIRAFQRPSGSGSQSRLEAIMKDDQLMEAPQQDVVSGMGGIISQTADYRNFPDAIGYSFLFFATEMVNNGEIKLLAIDGVTPTRQSVATGEYPFTAEFYAVTSGERSEQTQQFIDWILSPEGQELIARTGYTPLHPNDTP